MTALPAELYALRTAFREYVAARAPDIASFCGEALAADHVEVPLAAKPLPVSTQLAGMRDQTTAPLRPVVDAIIAAAPHLHWRHSYSETDPGIDAHFLQNSGWFNLIAPSGPFVSDEVRLAIGYWGQGLHYPRHHHQPEEIYLTLAGSADYISDGRATVRGGAGSTICHYSRQPHAADFAKAPLLAAAFWRGQGLEDTSVLVQ